MELVLVSFFLQELCFIRNLRLKIADKLGIDEELVKLKQLSADVLQNSCS